MKTTYRDRWLGRGAVALGALLSAVGTPCAAQPSATTAPFDRAAVPHADRGPALPAHWHRGAFMEIFVRAYQDSDGDGIGDLRGLISRLDHLQDLGVTGLWLMPVTKSWDRDHGYWTEDFRALEPDYGTLADFDELLRQARRRGIGIVIDYVINHAAASHPAFVAARADPRSPWRDWFVWSEAEPQGWDIWGKFPWYAVGNAPWDFRGETKELPRAAPGTRDFYFGTFGPQIPDFNLRHKPALDYHLDSLRFWLNRGLGGFRLDAVPHLVENGAQAWNDQPESRALTRQLQDLIKSYRHRWVVCEATQKPEDWGDDRVCGGAFAFGHVQHYVGAAQGKPESVAALAAYFRRASPNMATFVSNHDIFAGRRLWDQVGGDLTRYKLAAAGYLLQPGTPFIYYGEEVGQAGSPLPGDAQLRGPMSWLPDSADAGFTRGTPFRALASNVATHNARAQRADPDSIFHFYKAMLALRNGRPSVARGSFDNSFADGLVLGFERRLGAERTLVLLNYGMAPATLEASRLPGGAALRPLFPAAAPPHAAGATLTLPPLSLRVYDVAGPR